jgi:diacylglycerol kinase (ATP)
LNGRVPLIYNPASGGGRGSIRFREAEGLLATRGIPVDPMPTAGPRDAEEMAYRLCMDGCERLLVMGGDGTLSEAANGVLRAGTRPTLGFIPAGTGNDFLRDFGFTDRPHAIDRIALGTPRPVDAARIQWANGDGAHERFFINVFGTGFAAQAAEVTNRRYKWAGANAYNLGVLDRLIALRTTPTRLTLDGREMEGAYPLVMVCNSIHTGGAMQMAPMARPDDGLLDVLYVDRLNRRELLALLAGIREGRHVRHKKVHLERAKRVEIAPEAPSPLLVDGEVFGATPVRIEVLPGALQVLL